MAAGRGYLAGLVGLLVAASFQPASAGIPNGAPRLPRATGSQLPPPACPANNYQDAPVVFGCQGSGGDHYTRVLLEHFRERLDIGVPRGVTDFVVTMNASNFDGDLALYDPVAGVWVKDRLKGCSNHGTCDGHYKGVEIKMTATNGKPTSEKVVQPGPIPTALRLVVQSYAALGGAEFIIGYSYGPVTDETCVPAALAGCRKYDAVAARQAAIQWSRWATSYHPTVEEAWSTLAAGYAEIDRVPWHRWCNVWALWPAASKQAADCKAVFKYITAGGMEKGIDYVDRLSFTFAYDLSVTSTFNAMCCSKVRMAYPDEASAWSAFTANSRDGSDGNAGRDMYAGIAETIFGVCEALGRDRVVSLKDQWPRFIEENDSPGMQEQEFHSCWTTGMECPRYSYYRTQALLFGCLPETGHVSIVLPPGPRVVGDIPAGLLNLNLTVQVSGNDVDLSLKDTQSNDYAVKANGGACNSKKLSCDFHGAKLGWSGNMQATPGSPGSLGSVAFKDPTPTPLTLEVNTGSPSVSKAEVTYSYGGYKSCPNNPDADEPDVPAGCSFLDVTQAPPKACMDFSAFLELKHTDANGLLEYLTQTKSMESTALGPGVPFHLWPGVWADWPGKESHGPVWQECFHWCDGNHDGLIVQSELEQCFLLSRTHDMVDAFCGDLCNTYPNENALWATWANGAETIQGGRWESLWNGDSKVSTKGISPAHSFRYVDKDGDGAISKTEFKKCYSAGNCGHSWPLIGGILQGVGAAAGAAINAGAHLHGHHHDQSEGKMKENAGPSFRAKSTALAATSLEASATAGSTALQVVSNVGFEKGTKITIDSGSHEEVSEIASFNLGSVVLKSPLKFDHAAGTAVVPEAAGGSDSDESSASLNTIPIWVWPIVAVVVICLGILCAMAVAPFFVRGKKRATVSSIGEESQADPDHDHAYNNLSLMDEGGGGSPRRLDMMHPLRLSSRPGSSPFTTAVPMPPATMVPALPPPMQRPLQRTPLTSPLQVQPAGPVTTFVPYPPRGGMPRY